VNPAAGQRKLEHLRVVGSTQFGKTTWCNELHRRWPAFAWDGARKVPRYSIFVDTKGIDPLWGARVRSISPLGKAALHGQKLIWDPPRRADGIAWEEADAQLLGLWGSVQAAAQRTGWSSERDPWIQVLVDEAQQWEGTYVGADGKQHRHPGTLEDMAARGLGMGLRLVYITQYPAGIQPKTRNNLTSHVVFGLADEGRTVVENNWGWPKQIATHTRERFYYATYTRQAGWRYNPPRPRLAA
jgi:hypothetical protein